MNKKNILIIGDVLAFAILNIIGFATHKETGVSFLPRMAVAFFPIVFAWFVLAPWFGLFDETVINNSKNLFRIPLAFLPQVVVKNFASCDMLRLSKTKQQH